jgi:agmatinase
MAQPHNPAAPNSTPATFLGLPHCSDLSKLDAAVAILGVPVATPYPSSGLFAAGSPAAIRAGISTYSSNIGHHDFEIDGSLLDEAYGAVVDAGDLPAGDSDYTANRQSITRAVQRILDRGAAPVVIGGDDSVPIPVLQAYEDRGPVTILQIDAHIDWRDEVNGERYGLSSNMRRAAEMPWIKNIIQVGMRSVGSARQREYQEALDWGVHIVTARQLHRDGIDPVLELVPADSAVYVAFDCDSLDSSIMPAVLAPTPGGLSYWNVVDLLHGVAARAQFCGFSLVEFAPEKDRDGNAALTAARIIFNAAALLARKSQRPQQ